MVLYIDESGSINNHISYMSYFVIAMVHVVEKDKLCKAYKRFVSSNYNRLLELDADKTDDRTRRVTKSGGKMFVGRTFKELKGAKFDRAMKMKFVDFFSKKHYFDVYYIKLANERLPDSFFDDTARTFHYIVRLAVEYFIKNGLLPNEECYLQFDERNEKKETKTFLEHYLNTELILGGSAAGKFYVAYFDSAANKLVQIADIFANLYYSQLQTGRYTEAFQMLEEQEILKAVFEFPGGL